MEYLPEDQILKYNYNTLNDVRSIFGLDKPGVMKSCVDILDEWVKQQKHFVKKNFDRKYLELTIILCKGSIEKAKIRLDRACTLRTLNKQYFTISDVSDYYQNDLQHVKHAILPKITKDNGRVYLLKNSGKHFDSTVIRKLVRTFPSYGEYLRRHDYASHHYVIADYTDVNLYDLITKADLNDVRDMVSYLLDCCGFRLKGLYVISTSKVIDMAVAILKQFLSAKLAERVHILKDRESLLDYFDKEILPEEYGGSEKSLKKLHEEWLDVITSEDHIQYMRDMNSAGTDEDYRQKDKFNEQYMGMPGTFRTLSVD